MKKILFTLFVAISFVAFNQKTELEVRKMANTYSEQELVFESSTMLSNNQLFLAEILVDKLLTIKPESSNYNYRKGYILLYSKSDYLAAMVCFKKAIENTSVNYDLYSVNEKNASIDAFYHLGKCYHLNFELEKAKQYYNQFLITSNVKSDLIYKAHTSVLQCDVAKALMARPKKVTVKNIGAQINTIYPEYSPVVSLDGSAIYFTSRRPWANGETDGMRDGLNNDYPEDIYVSYSDEKGGWTTPIRLDFCEAERNEATIAVSSDEKRIYVYQDSKGGGDLFYSDFGTNSFTEIKDINYSGVNSESWETHCTMTTDGLNMYFVSDRPGGMGGRDIYRIVKLPDGSWSLPQNLGPNINTSNDEDSPFIASDNKTLYYSSNGPRSMGGFDIFVSIRDEDNVWGESLNLGYPINSVGDDIFYTATIDGLKGYMTSFRKNGYGEKDIYEIQNDYIGRNNIAALKGHIITVGGKPLPLDIKITVSCVNCEESMTNSTSPRLRDGTFFSSLLEHCRDYEYVITSESGQKELFREVVTTKCENEYHEIYREILLDVDQMKVISATTPQKETQTKVDSSLIARKDELNLKETGVKELLNNNNNLKDFEMIHYFGYNANVLTVNSGDLNVFLKQIEAQMLKGGRKQMVIIIETSASKVPTKTYKSNEQLSELRAKNIQKELLNYIAQNPNLKGKVSVKINKMIVDGPAYENDALNRKKYQKFQFVYLKTE
ncbi:MAG: PD40 domain-containing protein [Flavobacteriia bacterium]|nr:PD40 domain-containing protein [Flavobacteriia bacterium]